jgi:hypothetical protein
MAGRSSKPTLIVFSGGMRDTAVERLIGGARDAAALDTLAHAQGTGCFAGAILATDSENLAARAPDGVEVDIDSGGFDFEARLRSIVKIHSIKRPFYVGGGSIPLVSIEELASLAERASTANNLVISNNFYSADFVSWTPGGAIERLAAISSDNRLPQLLHSEAGLAHWEMDRTLTSQFDIDAPADVAVLKLYCAGGPHLRSHIDGVSIDLSRYERAMRYFLVPETVVVAGRFGSATWRYLERETACRIRVFSEERGMQADERERSGKVRSLLGFLMDEKGVAGLFAMLSALGSAVFLDTRVLFAHNHLEPSRADRFYSDLGEWQKIEQPLVREITRAAAEAPVPVILGGHSLVSGGIMALVQAAWDAHDSDAGMRPGVV